MLAKPLQFNDLSLNDNIYDDVSLTRAVGDNESEARLMKMLEAQAAHSVALGFEDDDAVATDTKRAEEEKRDLLQKALNMAASNGDADRVKKILGGKARQYVDIDAPDDEGSPPLIYAACFVSSNMLLSPPPVLGGHNSLTTAPLENSGTRKCRTSFD